MREMGINHNVSLKMNVFIKQTHFCVKVDTFIFLIVCNKIVIKNIRIAFSSGFFLHNIIHWDLIYLCCTLTMKFEWKYLEFKDFYSPLFLHTESESAHVTRSDTEELSSISTEIKETWAAFRFETFSRSLKSWIMCGF